MSTTVDDKPQYSKVRIGLMLAAVIMLLLVKGFGNFKFLPMQTAIMDFYNIQESSYGYLNTASSWITVICTIPFGFLVRKLRCNISIILGIGVAAFGIFFQSIAVTFPMLLIGRIIEGAGTGFANLVTGALTLTLVDKKHVSFWSCIMIMVGILPQVIMAKGGTALMVNSGIHFQVLFKIISLIYVCAIGLWLALVPFSLKITGIGNAAKPTREQTIRVIKNKNNWYVALANMLFSIASITFASYIIRYLTTKGIEQTKAATIYSYTTILGLFSMIIFGIISDKLKTKRKIAIMSFFSGTVALILLAIVPANFIWIYILMWGTLPRSIAGMSGSSAADIAELPADVPIVNSVKGTISGVGTIIFGILLGYSIQYLGYDFTIILMAIGMAIGGFLWILAKKIP
ncbi:MAG: MFS transporter [Lachnospiraceae bacterium]|nr:MFS transporter [Lachnospiraceae bacterium]